MQLSFVRYFVELQWSRGKMGKVSRGAYEIADAWQFWPNQYRQFSTRFQMVCDTDRNFEGVEMCLFNISMKKPLQASFTAHTCLSSSSWVHQERNLTSNCQVVDYILAA